MIMPKNATEKYNWNFKISSFDAGIGRNIKLSSILKFQQEIGEKQLFELGLDYKRLYNDGFVFMLVRTTALICKFPKFEDEITLTTWNRGVKGMLFGRCYVWRDKNGEKLIESKTAFALADAKNHTLIRPSAFDKYGLIGYADIDNNCPEPTKIKLPAEMCDIGTRLIRFSDLDYNCHLNNTVYADFITDFMPGGANGKIINEFSINFIGEAVLNDNINIIAGNDSGKIFYHGNHDRGNCFSAYCKI